MIMASTQNDEEKSNSNNVQAGSICPLNAASRMSAARGAHNRYGYFDLPSCQVCLLIVT